MGKRSKRIVEIVVGIMCFVLVFFMMVQFNTIETTNIANIKTMRETELREELGTWTTKYEELLAQYEDGEDKRTEYKSSLGTNDNTESLLKKELKESNILLGLTKVKGDGIIVTLSDNDEKRIQATDLIELVNELRLAGAEAISINGERIIATSEIVDINYSFIVINGNRLSSPYIVKTIGDQTYLESGLTAKDYGYMDNMIKGNGKTATLERTNDIVINKFTGTIDSKYMEDNKEE